MRFRVGAQAGLNPPSVLDSPTVTDLCGFWNWITTICTVDAFAGSGPEESESVGERRHDQVPWASVKPENQLNFISTSEKIRLITSWIPATKQVLDGFTELMGFIGKHERDASC